jgi:hypothetical protein
LPTGLEFIQLSERRDHALTPWRGTTQWTNSTATLNDQSLSLPPKDATVEDESDLLPNLPPCCCCDRLWWACASHRRFAASPCGDRSPGAPARAAATCRSCLAANNLATAASCRSVAWFPAARAPLLRPYECLPGSVRTGWSGLYVRHTRRTNGGEGANSAQSRHCRPPCADCPVTAAAACCVGKAPLWRLR